MINNQQQQEHTFSQPAPGAGNAGFTLIEVLVAVILITLVIAPLDGLLIRAEKLSETAQRRYIATNIAQEGLELTRVMRDNNWFAFRQADRWLDRGLCADANTTFNDNDRKFTLDRGLARRGLVGDFESANLYIQSDGTWSHEISQQSSGFERVLSIDCSTRESDLPYVTVTATVAWSEQGEDEQVQVKEKLYNWYPNTQ